MSQNKKGSLFTDFSCWLFIGTSLSPVLLFVAQPACQGSVDIARPYPVMSESAERLWGRTEDYMVELKSLVTVLTLRLEMCLKVCNNFI